MADDEYWNPLVPELTVTDLETSLRFYRAAGFSERFRREDPPFAYLGLGRAQIMLEEQHAGGWCIEPLNRPLGRGINFQIEVGDVQKTRDALASVGFAPFRELQESWYRVSETIEEGQREFLLQDPDGYLMRFSQPLGRRCRSRFLGDRSGSA
jgi:catechol 2,3-dioxygenase-like lactoylglutathione lyase family enzyme